MWENSYELGELLALTNARLRRIPQLADTTPFSERTFYFYVQQGLIPRRSGRRGPGTRYPASFIDRLIAIRRLQKTHGLSLAEIRLRLAAADDKTLSYVAAGGQPPASVGSALLSPGRYGEPPKVEPVEMAGFGEPEDALYEPDGIPELTQPVSTPMKDLLDVTDEDIAGIFDSLEEPGASDSHLDLSDIEVMMEAGEAPSGEKYISADQDIPPARNRETSPGGEHAAHHIPLGPDAELVLHRPLTQRQARQMKAVETLLRSILEDDEC